jgi:hypothetical protein
MRSGEENPGHALVQQLICCTNGDKGELQTVSGEASRNEVSVVVGDGADKGKSVDA